jgi:hypothetical protein
VRYLPGVVLLASCSFNTNVSSGVDAAIEIDAPDAAPDAPPDAAPLPLCSVNVATTPGTDRGRVGGGGGGANFGPLRCPVATDRIVGFAARMSNNNTLYNARSAHGFAIGTVTTVEIMGSGAEGWSPSTLSVVTQCPPGQVVDGLRAHAGANGNLFKDIDFRCARIDGTTAQTVANTVVHVAGSLTELNGADTQNCGAHEILYEMPNMTGSGFDSVNLFCAPTKCN